MSSQDEPQDTLHIAIVGMACRFPGANTLDAFWSNLRDGIETIATLDDEVLRANGVSPDELQDPHYVRSAPILEHIEDFDAAFFGYTPAEAELMDPQQRIFLECAWEALEHAGYNPETYEQSIGVFAGSRTNSYLYNIVSNPELLKGTGLFQISVGNDLANLATRISYKLNLNGPSYGVHTACSTSLVAIHLARQSLLLDECQIAIAGGVAINVPHQVGYLYQEGGILSPDGHCRAFDAQAQGTIFGSGAGVVILKRLDDALADGDSVYAIIRGSATNNDGFAKASFTAPSVDGQMAVILDAMAEAEVRPDDISYVETHGTGTALGDPIELRALTKAFRAGTTRKAFCPIGSVKTNVGHLDAAAGMSSLLKTVLALQHEHLPPSLHYTAPNPRIDFPSTPFYVNTTLTPWQRNGTPRRAGVSSFGFGGTNAHLILEEAPPRTPPAPAAPWQLLLLSAHTPTALETRTTQLATHLQQHPDSNLADVAYTLQVGRAALPHRRFLVCEDVVDAQMVLNDLPPARVGTAVSETRARPVVFLCSGQGTQYVGMGQALYDHEPVFRRTLDACAQMLEPELGIDLRTILYPPDAAAAAEATRVLGETWVTQPALFAVEYALAQVWQAWGVVPQAVIGHSIGEYVAACLAGVFSLADALRLVATRGRLMHQCPPGAMLTIPLPAADVQTWLPETIDIAAINSPTQCVVAGPIDTIGQFEEQLLAQDIPCRRLHTSHAFHSALLDSMIEAFAAEVAAITCHPPSSPIISNLTGTWLRDEEATDPQYWAQHLRQPVQFAQGVQTLLQQPEYVWLEIGPGTTLKTFVQQQSEQMEVFTSLRHPNDQRADQLLLLTALGQLWLSGIHIDWAAYHKHEERQRVPLPTYPFERQRYWIEAQTALPTTRDTDTQAITKKPLDEWFYQPVWQPSALLSDTDPTDKDQPVRWMVFCNTDAISHAFIEKIQEPNSVVTVYEGPHFIKHDDVTYTINPQDASDYLTVFENVETLPSHVVYLWRVGEVNAHTSSAQSNLAETTQTDTFYHLLYLTRALSQRIGLNQVQLIVASDSIHSITGNETLSPEKAVALGPCMVIAQEHPNIICRHVDLDTSIYNTVPNDVLVDQLITESLSQNDDQLIAYRDEQRLVQQYESVQLSPVEHVARLRPQGVYLITGGLGNVGMILAEELVRSVQARLILIGRSAFPERDAWTSWIESHDEDDTTSQKIRFVQTLEAQGSEVLVLQADVADRHQMQQAVQSSLERFGTIHGVMHAAGTLSESSFKAIREIDDTDCQAHLRPKVTGLLVLEEVLRSVKPDFYLLFSSLSSVLGGLGYVAYAAANIFLDAYAHQQNQIGTSTWISVDWDSWHYRWSEEHETSFGTTLSDLSITPQEGTEAFRRILSTEGLTQLIVSTGELQPRIDQWIKLKALRSQSGTSDVPSDTLNQFTHTSRGELERKVAAVWQRVLGVARVGIHDNFFDLGGNSLSGMHLLSELKRELQIQVAPVALFEAPTVSALVRMVLPEDSAPSQALKQDAPRIIDNQEPIAIVGMVGRFPGADSLDTFWRNLCDGAESVTFFTDAELRSAGIDETLLNNPHYVKARPILRDVTSFDATFFGYTPREAELMDPQHRLFLECAWEALEEAGYDSERFKGAIGIYGGASISTYLLNIYSNAGLVQSVDPLQTIIGNDKDSLTTSVSYKLNLTGPSIAVQTFCSTSLVAVHLACRSLHTGESDMALAGGVSVVVPQETGYLYQEDGILSPDGHSRAFDAQGQGTLFGNGVGIVVLKRLSDALNDRDHIYAVVKGSAINNDGSLKVGYTAPSVDGQAAVIRAAQIAAQTSPEMISYVETHGTATALGDPIEIAALTKAFRNGTNKTNFCAIGSIKSNVGHLDRAAGVASLIKTILALQHQQIPPSLFFESPNPKIDFETSPFHVNTRLIPWQSNGHPRQAGVSSLGFGGTNAHIIVEEAPPAQETTPSRSWQCIFLSAKTDTSLMQMTNNLGQYLVQHRELDVADVAYTLQVGRRVFEHRLAIVGQHREDIVQQLNATSLTTMMTMNTEVRDRPVAFLFSGQGAQYVSMGQDLYTNEPVFRMAVDQCAALLEAYLGLDIRTILYPTADNREMAVEQLNQTWLTQPALFVVEYALAQLWMTWGARPQAMLGHSIGEYVAACLADVFSLEDALRLVAMRGRLMYECPAGAMLAVSLAQSELAAILPADADIAAINSDTQCVVSGSITVIDQFEQQLQEQAIHYRRLQTSHAFHSALLDPIIDTFITEAAAITFRPPRIPVLSNVTGTWLRDDEATDPHYWGQHLRQPVRFAEGMTALLQHADWALVEIGPGQVLSSIASQHPQRTAEHIVVASMRKRQDTQSDDAMLMMALSTLYLAGVPLDWNGFYQDEQRQRVSLPTYPFERQHYWIEPDHTSLSNGYRLPSPTTDSKEHVQIYLPSWKQSRVSHLHYDHDAEQRHRCWLVFADTYDVGQPLITRLQAAQDNVITVQMGTDFNKVADDIYTLNPVQPEMYATLLQDLSDRHIAVDAVLHLWSVSSHVASDLTWHTFEDSQNHGLLSVLTIAKELQARITEDDIPLWILSNNLYEIHGTETIDPYKATLQGICKVIPQLYPQISCRVIDVTIDSITNPKWLNALYRELHTDSPDVVAYRGGYRWTPTMETLGPVSLDDIPEYTTRRRPHGTYLFTEGLGHIGLQFARYLTRGGEPTLIFADNVAVPERTQWEKWLSINPEQLTSTMLAQDQGTLLFALPQIMDGVVTQQYIDEIIRSDIYTTRAMSPEGLETISDTLCTSYICDFFTSQGITISAEAVYEREVLRQQLHIADSFVPLYHFILSVLEADQIVRLDGATIHFLKDAHELPSSAMVRSQLRTAYPEAETGTQALEYCISHYPQILTGAVNPISVLYPDGKLDMMQAVLDNQARFSNLSQCRAVIADVVAKLAHEYRGKPLRILEVGAGDGAMTWTTLPLLQQIPVEYYFTDISMSFINHAKDRIDEDALHVVQFGVLDIASDPIAQGYEPYSFDIIIAADVIHATAHIHNTLTHLTNLLAPNGLLCILEATRAQRWATMIWGVLDGWWHFKDYDIRQHSPLLTASMWQDALAKHTFQQIHTYPYTSEADYVVLIAQQQSIINTFGYFDWAAPKIQQHCTAIQQHIRTIQSLEASNATVWHVATDTTDKRALQQMISQTQEQFGAIHGVIHTQNAPTPTKHTTHLTRNTIPKVSSLYRDIQPLYTLNDMLPVETLDFAFVLSVTNTTYDETELLTEAAIAHVVDAFASVSIGSEHIDWTSIHWDGEPSEDHRLYQSIFTMHDAPHIFITTHQMRGDDWWKHVTQRTLHTIAKVNGRARYPRPQLITPYSAPNNEVEQRLTEIWEEALNVSPIGVNDSFLDFGGDSLQATRLVSQIRSTFQIDISLQTFFESPTISHTARCIEAAQSQQEDKDTEEILAMLDQLSDQEVEAEIQKRLSDSALR